MAAAGNGPALLRDAGDLKQEVNSDQGLNAEVAVSAGANNKLPQDASAQTNELK
jgi:hypothetical protein